MKRSHVSLGRTRGVGGDGGVGVDDGSIRVLIADDHPVYLDGLISAIDRCVDLELVAACRNGREVLNRIRGEAPDVAVLELRMPGLTASDILRRVGAGEVTCAVLILSVDVRGEDIHEALSLGAAGYVAKQADRTEICAAIRSVAAGQTVLSSDAQSSVATELLSRRNAARDKLSARETEILGMLASGQSAPEIAGRLHLIVVRE